MHHYTYMLTAQRGERLAYYFGVRTSRVLPSKDKDYMSSSTLVQYMRIQGVKFKKEILETFSTRKAANQAETALIEEFIHDENNINLFCEKLPYDEDLTLLKFSNLKNIFTEMRPPTFFVKDDPFKRIKPKDLPFRVSDSFAVGRAVGWLFVGHPEKLKFYYPATGTRTYWPGRPDKLMTEKNDERKFYVTDVENIIGTPMEQIIDAVDNHLVSGQRVPVIEHLIQFVFPLLDEEDYLTAKELLQSRIKPEHQFLLNRLPARKDEFKVYSPIERLTEEEARQRIQQRRFALA